MAGDWEPLLFRVRRDGGKGYIPTAQQCAAYEREHAPEMVARLKALGVNFVMMHCYKGAGLEAERESMSFPSLAFGGPEYAALTNRAEDLLIGNRVGFQIVFAHQLKAFRGCRTLLLAGCIAMGDREAETIRRFVAAGGRLCVIGPLATHDQWMQPRPKPALAELPGAAVVRAGEQDDWLAAVRRACGGSFSLRVGAKGPESAMASSQEGDVVRFTVPEVKIYDIAMVNY